MSRLNRPLFLSCNPDADGLQFRSTPDYLNHFKGNCGNLAFVYAMSRQIRGRKSYFTEIDISPEDYDKHFDCVVFPAANNLGEKFDMGWLAEIMEKSRLPMLIVGLGLQAEIGQFELNLPVGTRRFISLAKDQKLIIGVRGSTTQKMLADLGVETTIVTGCPSNFLNSSPNLGREIEKRFGHILETNWSLALNLEYFRLDKERVNIAVSWLKGRAGSLILQSDEALFSLVRGDYEGTEEKLRWFGKYFTGRLDDFDFKAWLTQYGRVYCHLPSWMDYLRTISISAGSRFHGNMLAMQMGVPAIVFPHDARTLEMCETMMVPHFPWKEIGVMQRFEDIVSQIRFDGAGYDLRRRELAKSYRALVENIGLDLDI